MDDVCNDLLLCELFEFCEHIIFDHYVEGSHPLKTKHCKQNVNRIVLVLKTVCFWSICRGECVCGVIIMPCSLPKLSL